MAQRSIEILIGRLITDEAFRSTFCNDANATLASFIEAGQELTATEIAALTTTSPAVWMLVSEQIDPRLQRASLSSAKVNSTKD
jgi:hypothetical protein